MEGQIQRLMVYVSRNVREERSEVLGIIVERLGDIDEEREALQSDLYAMVDKEMTATLNLNEALKG
jgi:hypothetical protein